MRGSPRPRPPTTRRGVSQPPRGSPDTSPGTVIPGAATRTTRERPRSIRPPCRTSASSRHVPITLQYTTPVKYGVSWPETTHRHRLVEQRHATFGLAAIEDGRMPLSVDRQRDRLGSRNRRPIVAAARRDGRWRLGQLAAVARDRRFEHGRNPCSMPSGTSSAWRWALHQPAGTRRPGRPGGSVRC